MRPLLALLLLAPLAGCGGSSSVDGAAVPDAATPPDAAAIPDLVAAPDEADWPDRSAPTDASVPLDSSAIPDFGEAPDLASPDLIPPPDLTTAPDLAQPLTLYVSTVGNDAWSGRLPDPNPGMTDGPLATLAEARDAARRLAPGGGAQVILRGGTYYLPQTFVLNSPDSGAPGLPARYAAMPGETPILVGGRPIAGFALYDNGPLYKADLSGDPAFKNTHFDQLYFNGQRMTLARYPNADPNAYSKGFLFVADVNGLPDPQLGFHAQPGTLHAWAHPELAVVSMFPGPVYWNNRLAVKGIDLVSGTVSFDPNVAYDSTRAMQLAARASYPLVPWNRYFFENVFEELDQPGEWYWDAAAQALYFWPPSDLQKGTVVVPTARPVIQIAPEPNAPHPPSDIILDGLVIDGATGDGIDVSGASNVVVRACTVRNVGITGIAVNGGARSGALGDDVYATGAGGIAISGGDPKTLTPAANFATNNYVHHTGALNKGLSGYGTVSVAGVGNIVSHNLIHDHPRIGITAGGNDHLVEYNRVRHVNLETQDSGCIYIDTRDWTQRGDTFRYNFASDCGGVGFPQGQLVYPYYTFGIYLDDFTSGAVVYGNLVARTYRAGLYVHSGRDNLLYNNVVVDPLGSEAILFGAWPPQSMAAMQFFPAMWAILQQRRADGPLYEQRYPNLASITSAQVGGTMSGNRAESNLVAWSADGVPLYRTSGLDEATTAIDGNLYFFGGKPITVSEEGALEPFADWQQRGFDQSSVIADPLFLDAAHDDYRLAPGSPAVALGFMEIPVSQIGPQGDLPRASWPIL